MFFPLIAKCLDIADDYDEKRVALSKPENETTKLRIDAIYTVLTTLDTKASALMRLDGILLAAAFVGIAAKLYDVQSWEFGTLVGFSIFSMILSLFVVSVDWKFLGYVQRAADGEFDFSPEIEILRKVRRFRERIYRWAWFLAFLSAADFAVIIGLRIF
jgi:hypothetical protein